MFNLKRIRFITRYIKDIVIKINVKIEITIVTALRVSKIIVFRRDLLKIIVIKDYRKIIVGLSLKNSSKNR